MWIQWLALIHQPVLIRVIRYTSVIDVTFFIKCHCRKKILCDFSMKNQEKKGNLLDDPLWVIGPERLMNAFEIGEMALHPAEENPGRDVTQ